MTSTVLKPKTPAEAKRMIKSGAFIGIQNSNGAFHHLAFFEKDGSLTFYGKRYEETEKGDWLGTWATIVMSKGYVLLSDLPR